MSEGHVNFVTSLSLLSASPFYQWISKENDSMPSRLPWIPKEDSSSADSPALQISPPQWLSEPWGHRGMNVTRSARGWCQMGKHPYPFLEGPSAPYPSLIHPPSKENPEPQESTRFSHAVCGLLQLICSAWAETLEKSHLCSREAR